MKQYTYDFNTREELEAAIAELKKNPDIRKAESVLLQMFTSNTDREATLEAEELVARELPGAFFAGASTSGEIAEGKIYEHTTVLTALCFEHSACRVLGFDCSNHREKEAGRALYAAASEIPELRGIEILSNVKGLNNASFISELDGLPEDVIIFGGGSDTYGGGICTSVFEGRNYYNHGIAAVIFSGRELNLKAAFSFGWKPLGRSMEITSVGMDGMVLSTVDHMPAIEIYRKYLKFSSEEDLHVHVDMFPIMLQRDGQILARAPIALNPDGSVTLGAEVKTGEKMTLGYGDPDALMQKTVEAADQMADFQAEGILLFCCIVRKAFLKEYASYDAEYFQGIAASAGFYTYGEIVRPEKRVETMNCTLVCIGMREGSARPETEFVCHRKAENLGGHMSVIQRLVTFVEATTADLENANRELKYYAEHDRMTDLLNRGEAEKEIRRVISRISRGNDRGALIMVDIDHFKQINDSFGHDVGDAVIRKISAILQANVRTYDSAGRWGGEEFMIILPGGEEKDALLVAERMRADIERTEFEGAGQVTISAGVSEIHVGEKPTEVYRRVDLALYEAKRNGRNRVVAAKKKGRQTGAKE